MAIGAHARCLRHPAGLSRRWRAVHSPDSKSTACPGESLVTTCSGITHLPADAGEASHHKSRLRGKAYQRVSLNLYEDAMSCNL